MARKRFHGLKRVKFRASWNKYNLYNLSRLQTPRIAFQTFYQQKWASKSLTRAYHGEQIREKQWQRMFTPDLKAVVPMDHRYLAEHDGSEHAAGRGSGLEQPLGKKRAPKGGIIPYMHMTYAPIERRLDMAIFRSLFASSARQARQFVTHGKVKVNGKNMPYPGYLLNPGDMFQVEPDAVLFATGAPKDAAQKKQGRKVRLARKNTNISLEKFEATRRERRAVLATKKAEQEAAADASGDSTKFAKPSKASLLDNLEIRNQRQADVAELLRRADSLFSSRSKPLSAKHKQMVRAFVRKARTFRAQVFRLPIAELEKQRTALIAEWNIARFSPKSQEKFEANKDKPKKPRKPREVDPNRPPRITYNEKVDAQRREERKNAMKSIREAQVDPSKPYATPWRPRPYMSAFAFVPRYLEVSHKVCSAVYLRHPVARPGLSEVPSPFPGEVQQLAFTWYLRRR